ncbi:MAG: methyl-accepting chemotaxis protein [Cyanobacteria bacterium P01_D01_bin.123]
MTQIPNPKNPKSGTASNGKSAVNDRKAKAESTSSGKNGGLAKDKADRAKDKADKTVESTAAVPMAQKASVEPTKPLVSKPDSSVAAPEGESGFWSTLTHAWNQQSLQRKATAAALALGILPAALVGSIAVLQSRAVVQSRIKSSQESLLLELTQEVGIYTRDRINEVRDLAQTPILTNPRLIEASTLQDKIGLLNSFIDTYGGYDSVVMFDLKGNPLYQSKSSRPFSGNYSNRPFFQRAIATQEFAFKDPSVSESSGRVSLEMTAPVKENGTGRLLGVLRARIPADELQNIFDRSEEAGYQYNLINQAGTFFASNEAEIIGEDAGREARELDGVRDRLAITYLDETVDEVLARDGVRADSLQNVITFDNAKDLEDGGERLVLSVATVEESRSTAADLGWLITLSQERDEAFAPARTLFWTLLGITTVAAGVIAAVAVIGARRAVKPVLDAASAVDKIGRGDLDARLQIQGNDELAILGNNVNEMAARLETLVSEQSASAEQAGVLADVTAASVFTDEERQQVFAKALGDARQLLKCDRVVVYRFNEDFSGYIAHENVAAGWPRALDDIVTDPCIPEQLLEAYRNGRVVPTNNVTKAGFHPDHRALLDRLKVKSNLVVPLLSQSNLYGLVVAHHCAGPHEWQESEISFMRQLALQLGSLLDRLAFLGARDAEAERARLLKDITVEVSQLESVESLLNNLPLDKVRQGIQSDRVIVYTFDENWQGTIVAESVREGWPKAIGARITDPCFADNYVEKYQQGRVQSTADIYDAGLTECHLQQLEPFAVRANLVVPILQANRLLGLLIAHQCSGPREWEQETTDYVTQVSTQVGFALDRIDLLDRQMLSEESQRREKELLQRRALELLMQVDPISRGDLTVRAQVTEDEIGTIADSYNATVRSLREIVEQVQSAAQQVAVTTNTNEVSVRSLAEESVQQATDIAEALNRIEEMSDSIRAVAVNAEEAETAVQVATQTVQQGDRAMNRTVDGILAIRETVAETSKKVKRLGESSQRISKVVNLISAFADQTNLLALNASIEAARAGEQGRGFAVVADEVRSLARQSADATAEIEKLVAEIQTGTNEVVAAMEEGTEQVVTGTKLVEEARQSLTQIADVSDRINELVDKIAQATEVQSRDSEVVTKTITDVAQVASKTSLSASEVSDSFKQLLTVAQSLQQNVSQFKVE